MQLHTWGEPERAPHIDKFAVKFPDCSWLVLVSAPDPNQPQRGSLLVSRDTGSDPRWGWFGSGTETRLVRDQVPGFEARKIRAASDLRHNKY